MAATVFLAALPDLAQPTVLALGGAFGAFFGGTVARLRRFDRERRVELTHDMGYAGFGIALFVYLVANALEV